MKKLFTLIALAMSFMGGDAQTTYKEFETTTVFIPTADNLSANKDWLNIGTFETKRKTTIDPSTGIALEKATAYPSGAVKNGDSKVFSFNVTGVSYVLVTLTSTSSASSRYAVAKVTEEGSKEPSVLTSESVTSTNTTIFSLSLDEGKKYSVSLFGQTADKTVEDKFSGDIAVFGVTFVKSESLKTAKSSFSTYSAAYPVNYKENGLVAYSISLDETSRKVSYTEIDGVVPSNTPVLVKGESEKDYVLEPATVGAAEVTTSLQVSDGKVVTEGDLYYAFSTVDGKSGFKRIANGITIPAKKGYLKLASASAKSFFSFDDETTGIKGIENGTVAEENAPLYNLAGQRVSKDYKGVVVKNGKKFFNK